MRVQIAPEHKVGLNNIMGPVEDLMEHEVEMPVVPRQTLICCPIYMDKSDDDRGRKIGCWRCSDGAACLCEKLRFSRFG